MSDANRPRSAHFGLAMTHQWHSTLARRATRLRPEVRHNTCTSCWLGDAVG